MLLNGLGRVLLVEVVGELGVVLDVRDADLSVVAVEDAGDFLESGTPVEKLKSAAEAHDWKYQQDKGTTYLVST